MLKNHASRSPLSQRLLVFVAIAASLPMAIAFAAQKPKPGDRPAPGGGSAPDHPAVQRRAVNRRVKDFPEKVDLSTPEGAMAALIRAWARRDHRAAQAALWPMYGPRDIGEDERVYKSNPKKYDALN